jgi:hypothetical protein
MGGKAHGYTLVIHIYVYIYVCIYVRCLHLLFGGYGVQLAGGELAEVLHLHAKPRHL